MHCGIPTPTYDSNTSTGMMWATLNMPSAVEECREPWGKCQRISHCLESGHPETARFVLVIKSWWFVVFSVLLSMVTFMLWVFIVYNYLLLNYYSATAARSIVIVASVTHSVCERITHECINGRRPNVVEVGHSFCLWADNSRMH